MPVIAVDVLTAQLAETELLTALPGSAGLDLDFPSAAGTPLNESHMLARFQRVLEAARLPKRRMHDLRHTYATRLFALGQHPRAVQDLLGHSRFDITMNLYTGVTGSIELRTRPKAERVGFEPTKAF